MKDINALREALFETLQAVRNGDMQLDQARAINDLSKTLVDTARVEVDFLRANGGGDSRFLNTEAGPMIGHDKPANGIVSITRHIMK